jgi:hypothetical protein
MEPKWDYLPWLSVYDEVEWHEINQRTNTTSYWILVILSTSVGKMLCFYSLCVLLFPCQQINVQHSHQHSDTSTQSSTPKTIIDTCGHEHQQKCKVSHKKIERLGMKGVVTGSSLWRLKVECHFDQVRWSPAYFARFGFFFCALVCFARFTFLLCCFCLFSYALFAWFACFYLHWLLVCFRLLCLLLLLCLRLINLLLFALITCLLLFAFLAFICLCCLL